MIVRGCSDFDRLLETIEQCGYLGAFDMSEFEIFATLYPNVTFDCNPGELSDFTTEGNCFGFWLPHDIPRGEKEYIDAIDERLARFNRIERVFKRHFDIPDDELQLDPAAK